MKGEDKEWDDKKYLVLIRQYKNGSIIKDHLIFKDQQYQKHKVEYKKIVFYKYDLIKAVYSYSLPQ